MHSITHLKAWPQYRLKWCPNCMQSKGILQRAAARRAFPQEHLLRAGSPTNPAANCAQTLLSPFQSLHDLTCTAGPKSRVQLSVSCCTGQLQHVVREEYCFSARSNPGTPRMSGTPLLQESAFACTSFTLPGGCIDTSCDKSQLVAQRHWHRCH